MSTHTQSQQQSPPLVQDDTLVSIGELGELLRRTRRKQGLSREEAARVLGVEVETIIRAENYRLSPMLRLRKRLLKRLAGYTLEGPFYQVRSIEQD